LESDALDAAGTGSSPFLFKSSSLGPVLEDITAKLKLVIMKIAAQTDVTLLNIVAADDDEVIPWIPPPNAPLTPPPFPD
jgi:hypothetical protein